MGCDETSEGEAIVNKRKAIVVRHRTTNIGRRHFVVVVIVVVVIVIVIVVNVRLFVVCLRIHPKLLASGIAHRRRQLHLQGEQLVFG